MQTPWPRQMGAHGLAVPWLSHAGVSDFNTWFHQFETLSCALEVPSPSLAVSSIHTGRVRVNSTAWPKGAEGCNRCHPSSFPRELWGCGSRGAALFQWDRRAEPVVTRVTPHRAVPPHAAVGGGVISWCWEPGMGIF